MENFGGQKNERTNRRNFLSNTSKTWKKQSRVESWSGRFLEASFFYSAVDRNKKKRANKSKNNSRLQSAVCTRWLFVTDDGTIDPVDRRNKGLLTYPDSGPDTPSEALLWECGIRADWEPTHSTLFDSPFSFCCCCCCCYFPTAIGCAFTAKYRCSRNETSIHHIRRLPPLLLFSSLHSDTSRWTCALWSARHTSRWMPTYYLSHE